MNIHPAADLFPMMSDEELQELAADIAANGLIHPIVIDENKQIIDGRNRLKACKLAGIKPTFEQLNGRDPLAYIVSANLERRNLTKGQQAMALAMIYPEPEKGRPKKGEERKGSETKPFSKARLSQARVVLAHSLGLAQDVIKGTISLDQALTEVDSARQRANTTEAKLERLQKDAPDLAARVADENISLQEGLTILHDRQMALQRIKDAGKSAAHNIFEFVGHVSSIHSALEAGEDLKIDPAQIETIGAAFQMLIEDMQRSRNEKSAAS